jgi:hypothetical protein
MADLRVEKQRIQAVVTLSNGTEVCGFVFGSAYSATHAGPEGVKDVLTENPTFFPLQVVDNGRQRTMLYNREHVVMVTLSSDDEMRHDPAYELASRRHVSMLLSTGARLEGSVRIVQPQGRDRLSDYVRSSDPFWYVEASGLTLIVNPRHVLELMELSDQ